MTTAEDHSSAKLFRLSFSVRTLFAFVFCCAAFAAFWAAFIGPRLEARHRARLLASLRERGYAVQGPKASNQRRNQPLSREDLTLLSAAGVRAYQSRGCDNATLRQLSRLKELRLLDLEGLFDCNYTEAGLQHLADLPDLRALKLYKYAFTAEELSSLGQLDQLEILALQTHSRDAVLDGGLESWSGLGQLQALDLRTFRLTENALGEFGRLPQLTSLTFRDCSGLTDEGLSRVGELQNLKELHFLHCQDLTDEGLRHIGQLKELESLSLACDEASQVDFTDAGVRHLRGLPKLKNLCLYSPRLSDELFVTVRDMPQLSSLVLGLTPPHAGPSKETARWVDTVCPVAITDEDAAEKAGLLALVELRKKPDLKIFCAGRTWGVQLSEYHVPALFGGTTFELHEQRELYERTLR